MKIIFFGLGSIGKKHALLLKKNYPQHQLWAFRSGSSTSPNSTSSNLTSPNELGLPEIKDLAELEKIQPDAAFITNPTSEHLKYAIYCAKKKINLFIEKPLDKSNKNLSAFIKEVKKSKVKVYVAYCLRFHPVIQWLKEYLREHHPIHATINCSSYLPNWRKNGPHLQSYSAQKELGGGVILDLSHEIDYLYYLFGKVKKIKANAAKISDVTVDAEDFADVLLQFDKVYANLHLNFLSRLKRREIIIDFKDQTIIADLINSKVVILKENKNLVRKFAGEPDQMYLSQLHYFFNLLKEDNLSPNKSEDKSNIINEIVDVFNLILKIKKEASL